MKELFEHHSEIMTIFSLLFATGVGALYNTKAVRDRTLVRYALLAVLAITFGFFLDVGMSPISKSLDWSGQLQLVLFTGGIVYYMCLLFSLLRR